MNKAKVFMIMPFEDEFFEVYEILRQEFEEQFVFSNAADEDNQQNILKDIIQPIYESDIIIADLTKLNSNVLYELGIAHTFNKKTIIITQDELESLPFDLRQYRAKKYSTQFKRFIELLEHVRTNLAGAISGEVVFSNPVKDFIADHVTGNITWFSDEKISILLDETDRGFIDFLADLESDTSTMAENMDKMNTDLENMINGISQNVIAIENAQKSKGNSTASFIQKEARKAAGHLSAFSKKLKGYNNGYSDLWNKIEKNTLGLLETPYISSSDENKKSAISFLTTLKGLQLSISTCSRSVESLKTSSLGNLGIQRTLNQAIRFLDEDLKTYLDILEFIINSIDKILAKSKFVVGAIDFSEEASLA